MNKLAPRRFIPENGTVNGHVLRPVFGIDIDGTLGDWHAEFLFFAAKYLCRAIPPYDGDKALFQHIGVSKHTYRQMKLAFRQSGLKRAMRVFPGAVSLVRALRAAGAEVWVCTTRPYLRLDNIDPDTRWWLRHHGLTYDGVLFGEKKYADLQRLVGSGRVLGVLDDMVDQVEAASRIGLPAYLVDRAHNGMVTDVHRLTLREAEHVFTEKVRHYLQERHVRA